VSGEAAGTDGGRRRLDARLEIRIGSGTKAAFARAARRRGMTPAEMVRAQVERVAAEG
jgi:antitoxin component of RelBE/YafQ-DinJ toxin-antitoxin module